MTERNEKLEAWHARLESVARGLAICFGPEKAADLVGGALVSLCMAAGGRVAAIEFLEDLATQLREDHPENWTPEDSSGSTT